MFKIALLSTLSLLLLSGCFGSGSKEEKWTSFIYPDKSNQKRSMKFAEFNSLKECKDASINRLKSLGFEQRGYFKCGLNCEYHEGMKTEICERMETN